MNLFEIPGNPRAWKRARCNGKVFFDSQKSEKERLQMFLKSQMKDYEIQEGGLSLKLTFYMPIPSYLSQKKKQELDYTLHDKKPDLDNLIKFILDTFNNFLWKDDKQIGRLSAKKIYSLEPKTIINIENM